MSRIAKTSLTAAAVFVLLFIAAVATFWLRFVGHPPAVDWSAKDATQSVEYYKLLKDVVEMILVGIVVALGGVGIPAFLTMRKEAFENFKDSRKAYSEATTGIRYLPMRLAALNLADGTALINQVHEKKHIAETYKELGDQLMRRRAASDIIEHDHTDEPNPRKRLVLRWGDDTWDVLEAYSKTLAANANSWNIMPATERHKLLEQAQHVEALKRRHHYLFL